MDKHNGIIKLNNLSPKEWVDVKKTSKKTAPPIVMFISNNRGTVHMVVIKLII
jgi:hypothetical protein